VSHLVWLLVNKELSAMVRSAVESSEHSQSGGNFDQDHSSSYSAQLSPEELDVFVRTRGDRTSTHFYYDRIIQRCPTTYDEEDGTNDIPVVVSSTNHVIFVVLL